MSQRAKELLDRFNIVSEIVPCLHSGYCCKKVPCPWGEVNPDTGWCKHLEEREPNRWYCGDYDHISKQPGANIVPAFGAGCSSPLFNTAREAILKESQ